jgi:hypothetical protein
MSNPRKERPVYNEEANAEPLYDAVNQTLGAVPEPANPGARGA